MSVTVVSCVYGDRYDRFITEWALAIGDLDPAPDCVIVASDKTRVIPGAIVVSELCEWEHPQAFYLQRAVMTAGTDWVWIVDIDDLALPNALAGLDEVDADVWQMGYLRDRAEPYIVPQLTGRQYLNMTGNPFTAGSAIRADIFEEAGGFYDVAFQDWALWRRLARVGAVFQSSGRAHYKYRRHPGTRTELELTPDQRARHEEEMTANEH